MAGRDESARLQGMLTDLAGTVGEMGAGRDWGANAIRQIARPDNQAMFRGQDFGLDNSENVMKMAQWAERNGYEDKAQRYSALGYKLAEKEEQEAKEAALGKTLADASLIGSGAQQAGNEGDLESASTNIDKLKALLQRDDIQASPEAVLRISATIDSLNSQSEQFRQNQIQSSARSLAGLDMRLSALDQSDPDYPTKKANIEKAKGDLLSIPGVEEVYEGNRLSLMELRNKKVSAQWTAQSPAIIAEMSAAGTDVNALEEIEDNYPQFAPQIVAIKGEMVELAESLGEVRDKTFRVEQLPSRIERDLQEIEESTLSEEQKKFARDLLAGASNAIAGGSEYKGSAISAYEKAMTQINQMRVTEMAAQAGVERQRTDRALVVLEKAMQTQVSLADAVELAELTYGKNPNEDQIGKMEDKLREELIDYRYRAAIAAGKEAPQELDTDDKRLLHNRLNNGYYGENYDVAVMRATYDLASQGYSKEGIVGFLKKELPKQYADSAEQIYDDMWTDLENQDAQTASPAEVRANPYRREPGFRWLDRAAETLDARYQGFLQRRSQTMTTQPRGG